jgi:hypothetical protein
MHKKVVCIKGKTWSSRITVVAQFSHVPFFIKNGLVYSHVQMRFVFRFFLCKFILYFFLNKELTGATEPKAITRGTRY